MQRALVHVDRWLRRAGAAVLRRAARPAVVALACVPACHAAESVTTRTFTEPSTGRIYEVVMRLGHAAQEPAPVVFALHAYSTPPSVLLESWSLAKHAVIERGMLLVVPHGELDDLGHPFWNASAGCCGQTARLPDDVAYLRAVLADVARHYAIMRERVYAVGASNGAFMAHRWACTPGGDLHGIVAVSGMAPSTSDGACAPSVPVKVLHIHGDADDVIRYEGGEGVRGRYPSARASVELWQKLNHCDSEFREERSWSPLNGPTRKLRAHGGSAAVVLWTFEGGSHWLRSLRFGVGDLLDFLDGPGAAF